jgi:hypothetical protein
MSKLSKIVWAVLGVAVLALGVMPANANCAGGDPQISSPFIATNRDFYDACGRSEGYVYGSSCSPAQPGTPGGPGYVGPNARFFYWAAGAGNPAPGLGHDSGTGVVVEKRAPDVQYAEWAYFSWQVINSSARIPPGTGQNVEIDATLPNGFLSDPLAFSNGGGACAPCANITYLLYQTTGVRPGGGTPATRNTESLDSGTGTPWTLIPGQPVGGTPVGSQVNDLLVNCGAPGSQQNAWIAAKLLLNSGYQTFVVGGDSTRVECGPNLNDGDINDPQLQPRPRPRPDATPQKPGRRTSSSR